MFFFFAKILCMGGALNNFLLPSGESEPNEKHGT
jgi:hypothetical protein